MEKPLFLVDVDGPLNPYAAKPERRPEGYETFRYYEKNRTPWDKPLRVWLNPTHGEMFKKLSEVFDFVWATTWVGEANSFISPKLNLPEWPFIDFDVKFAPNAKPTYAFGKTKGVYPVYWKTPAVLQYVKKRSFAWIDDEVGKGDDLWLEERVRAPYKLIRIDPKIGLKQSNLDNAVEWAKSLEDNS